MRKLIQRRLARLLAFVSTQYTLIAVGTASATIWIVSMTRGVIAGKFDSIANALHKLH